MGRWREKARGVIRQKFLEAKAQGLRGRAVRRYITKAYGDYAPSRKKYPYRVWLDELEAMMYPEIHGVAQKQLDLKFC